MLIIASRDFTALWRTPAGWLLCAGTVFLLGWWFLTLLERYRREHEPVLVRMQSDLGVADLVVTPFLGGLPTFALLLVSAGALAARQLADERRSGTLELLFGSPRSTAAIVLGKYLGALAFLTCLLTLWLALPASLWTMTNLDAGRLLACALGLWLAAAALLAIALLCASLATQPGIAAVLSVVTGLLLLLVAPGEAGGVMSWLSLPAHYRPFLDGVVRLEGVSYFAIIIGLALGLSMWRLHRLREG